MRPFPLGEDIDLLRDTVRQFAAKEIAPRAAQIDHDNLFPADLWKKLYRPLHLPAVAAGESCPVSAVDAKFNFDKYGVARGIGRGPAYPIGFSQPGSVLQYLDPPPVNSEFAGSNWNGQKVLWFVAPSYRGPVLIRGRRLDAPDVLRFERGKVPPPSCVYARASASWEIQV